MLRVAWMVLLLAVLPCVSSCTTTRWKSVAPASLSTLSPRTDPSEPLHLLLAGEQTAYELDFRNYKDGVLNGFILRAWQVNPGFPVDMRRFDGQSATEIAHEHHWREIPVPSTEPRGLRFASLQFATAGEPRSSGTRHAAIGLAVVLTAAVVTVVVTAVVVSASIGSAY